jgi:hypothetical protein
MAEKAKYKVVQIWPGLFVCKQVTVCPSRILSTLYMVMSPGQHAEQNHNIRQVINPLKGWNNSDIL